MHFVVGHAQFAFGLLEALLKPETLTLHAAQCSHEVGGPIPKNHYRIYQSKSCTLKQGPCRFTKR